MVLIKRLAENYSNVADTNLKIQKLSKPKQDKPKAIYAKTYND